jgi:hypothetical protein
MKKYILCIAFFLSFFILVSQVSADIIMPGEKTISYCFEISNVNEFPSYYFITGYDFTKPAAGYVIPEIIEQGGCYHFYKYARPTIYAIKDAELNRSLFKDGILLYEYNDVFYNITNLIPSGITLQYRSTFPENNPLKGMVDILTITTVNDEQLTIMKDNVIYTYVDGSTEMKRYSDQDIRPEPSRKALLPVWWPQLLIALAITITLEFLIIWAFLRGKPLKPFLFSLIVNTITLPIATLVATNLKLPYRSSWPIVELGVFLIEFLLIKKFLNQSYPRALLISFVTNLVSAIIGTGIAILTLATGFLF